MPKISLKNFLQKIKKRHTRATPFVLSSQIGKPEWRCMDYPKLVQEGYEHNVIVYRCINLIARGIASVPWVLYEKDASGIEHEVEHHPLLTLLQHPSAEQAGSSLMEVLMSYLLLSGNAFLEAVFDEYAKPTGLYVLRPDRVALIPGEDGESIGLEYNLSGTRKKIYFSDFPHRPILHLKLFHPLHDVYGLSPLRAAARSIDQHNEVASHNLSLLENGGHPTGALVVKDQNLTFEQRQHLKENLQQLYQGGSNAGKIMILEGEFEWKEMGLSPKDLDFLEGRNISAREIAQAFGVPSMLVGVTGDATYANYKEARLHLWEDTIIPMLEHLMDELNLWLSPLFGNNLRLGFDIDGIPALSEKREAYWDKISQANFLTLNEKRQAVGYSPLPGGDVLGGKNGDQ